MPYADPQVRRDKGREYARKQYEKRKEQSGRGYNYEGYLRGQQSARTRANRLLNAARRRARKRGLPVTVTTEWVETKIRAGVCEVSGLPLSLSAGGHDPHAPSLDRIEPEEGYTPENTRVVVWIYNAAKHVFTDAAVLQLAQALCDTHENR